MIGDPDRDVPSGALPPPPPTPPFPGSPPPPPTPPAPGSPPPPPAAAWGPAPDGRVWRVGATTTGGVTGTLLPLRPLALSDIIDGAFRLLRATFPVVALVVVVVQGGYQLLSNYLIVQTVPEVLDPFSLDPFAPDLVDLDLLGRTLTVGLVTGLLGLVVSVITSAAVVEAALERDRGGQPRVGSVLGASVRRIGATLGATLLGLLAGGVAALALMVVLVPLGVLVPPLAVLVAIPLVLALLIGVGALSTLVLPVAMLETERGAWATFTRALWVIRHRFGQVLAVTAVAAVVLLLVTLALGVAVTVLAALAGPAGWAVDAVGATLTAVVTTPVIAYVGLLVLLDARVRLEGFDLTVRAQRLGPS